MGGLDGSEKEGGGVMGKGRVEEVEQARDSHIAITINSVMYHPC